MRSLKMLKLIQCKKKFFLMGSGLFIRYPLFYGNPEKSYFIGR